MVLMIDMPLVDLNVRLLATSSVETDWIALRIIHVSRPSSGGSTTPNSVSQVQGQGQGIRTSSPRGRGQVQSLARGPGGASISEVANLWKGSWAVSKGVNDVDWGTGGESQGDGETNV